MTNRGNTFVTLHPGASLQLPTTDRFPEAGHLWEQAEIDALILSYATRRPLLVRGEAGSGKSQIARAAAQELETELFVEVIHPRFEALDLLYQVDTVARLADAQDKNLDRTNERYVKRGRLWQAIEAAKHATNRPVLLIDEIDKADSDVPNALLEVLGNRSFPVPSLGDHIVRAVDGRLPLVIITTNEERELPPAFVRRCVVLNLNPPKDETRFTAWLTERASVHKHLRVSDAARQQAAVQVFADRNVATSHGHPPVGLAEYIDLLTALHELTATCAEEEQAEKAQLDWLQRLSAYALVKNADQDQTRGPQPLSRSQSSPDAPAPLAVGASM